MADKTHIACIDVGTTGARTIIFDRQGEVVAQAYEEYSSIFLTPTWIDHDPYTWIEGAKNTFRRAVKEFSGSAECIAAVAVISQRATFTPVDEQGVPLSNAILWQDKRALEQTAAIREDLGEEEIYRRTGLRLDPYFSLPKLLWVKENRPEIFNKAHKFLTVHDLVIYHLTGAFVTDWTQASRTMLFNIEKLAWDTELCEHFGIDPDKFPAAVRPGTVVGELTPAVQRELEINCSIPVVAVGGDQQAAAVGLGVVAPEQMCVNTGTGSFILAHAEQPVFDPERRIVCTASSTGRWLLEAGIFTTGSVYRWFRDNFAMMEKQTASALDIDAYEVLNSEVKNARPGSGGILWMPHFAGSAAPYWDPDAMGVIFGLSVGHRRAEVIRALLEGLAMEINKNIEIIESLVGEIGEIRVSGGATRSTTFNQIQADVYGKTVRRGISEQSSALGAMILASVAVGLDDDLESATGRLVRLDPHNERHPDERAHAVYAEVSGLHHELYQALQSAGIYDKAHKIRELLSS